MCTIAYVGFMSDGFVSHHLMLVKLKGTLESDIRNVFGAHGSVSKVAIPIDRATVSNGNVYVKYNDPPSDPSAATAKMSITDDTIFVLLTYYAREDPVDSHL